MNQLHTGMLAGCIAISGCLAGPVHAQRKMLVTTQENCQLIKGYSKYDLAGVAAALDVPVAKVSYVKAKWGRSPTVGHQCQMVFSTPKGPKSCTVLSITKDEFVFGQVVSGQGNRAMCF